MAEVEDGAGAEPAGATRLRDQGTDLKDPIGCFLFSTVLDLGHFLLGRGLNSPKEGGPIEFAFAREPQFPNTA